jgi:anti-anti-sigma regulatory factor
VTLGRLANDSASTRHTIATDGSHDGSMLNLTMSTVGGCAVLGVTGSWHSADDADTMAAALSFVPVDDHVVLDLRDLDRMSPACAQHLGTQLLERVAWAEVVVVADRPHVSMALVLSDIDRIVPLVRTVDDALEVVRARAGRDVMEAVR